MEKNNSDISDVQFKMYNSGKGCCLLLVSVVIYWEVLPLKYGLKLQWKILWGITVKFLGPTVSLPPCYHPPLPLCWHGAVMFDIFILKSKAKQRMCFSNRGKQVHKCYVLLSFVPFTQTMSPLPSADLCVMYKTQTLFNLFNLVVLRFWADESEASGRNRSPQMSEWALHHSLWPHPVRRQLSYPHRTQIHQEEELKNDVGAGFDCWMDQRPRETHRFQTVV